MNRAVQSLSLEAIARELTQIWSEVLGVPVSRIGLDDNFFSLGGDSLRIARVADRVNACYFEADPDDGLPITRFFALGTIRALAAHLHSQLTGAEPEVPATAAAEGETGAIAIIGMAGRFPGAADLDGFWRNLRDGVESIRHFSADELLDAGVGTAELNEPRYVRAGTLLESVKDFDAGYFTLTPREAALASPEQRLLIECSEEALQDAGYGVVAPGERVGVYMGTGLSSYLLQNLSATRPGRFESMAAMALFASNTAAASRVSYLLDLTGPSITLDTACSSSLVAVHQACQALLRGECTMALAGGATVRSFEPRGYHTEEGSIFSPDGHCRPFDRDAQGTVSSSGAGVVLLKRLAQAIADGDTIHAVIRGTAINNDGGAKAGYTAPSPAGQASVIRGALAAAHVEAESVQFLETHGTATALGDRIELAALEEVFSPRAADAERCTLGAVKANIGHVEAAAGVAGLIKVALALKHRQIPPAIHLRQPSEALAASGFRINTQLETWPAGRSPRRAGVSSFGIGGTNAHAILEEAPLAPRGTSRRDAQLLVLSARSEAALRDARRALGERLLTAPDANLADIAYTLQVGRKAFPYRHFVVSSKATDAGQLLLEDRAELPVSAATDVASPVFMFPGQGSQQPGMTREIYATEPVFREQMDRCSQLLHPLIGRDLRTLLYGSSPDPLSETALCQPALFAVEYSLARMWMSWGVRPSTMIGHSLGEYVAACLSGLFTLEDALKVVAARGRLMQTTPPGKMLAVRTDRAQTERFLMGSCALAAVNGPRSCVVSGPAAEIEQLKMTLSARNVPTADLRATRAFHSPLMDSVLQDFATVLRDVQWGAVRIPFVSNLTGNLIVDEQRVASPDYWVAHLRHTVDFSAGAHTLLQRTRQLFVEVGPGTVLGSLLRSMPGAHNHSIVSSGRRADDPVGDEGALLNAIGRTWQSGVAVDWRAFNASGKPRRVPLPTYPFERRRHWIGPRQTAAAERAALLDWFHVPTWKQRHRVPSATDSTLLADAASGVSCCLLIQGWPELERALEHRLSKQSVLLVSVEFAGEYGCADGRYQIDPLDPSSYKQLFADLRARGLSPSTIIHGGEAVATRAEFPDERRLSRSVLNVLDLCCSLAGQMQKKLQLTLLTQAAHTVTGDEEVDPSKSMMAAGGRVISREFPNIVCRSIDFITPSARGLADEITSPTDDEFVVLRGSSRWVLDFERLRPSPVDSRCDLLRPGGAYLVTGGLGGIGWTLAAYLARTLQARLILVGRSQLPDRERIEAIRELEATGAQIEVVQGDVAKSADVERIAAFARTRFGELHGIIHAAGVAGGGAIYLKTREKAAQVLAPKVAGTQILHDVCSRFDLDFFVCCSSLAAVLTPPGQYDYSAANAFQDAFCHAHDGKTRTRYISINWDAWRTVGMAVKTPVPNHMREQRSRELASGVSCEEGEEVFRVVLQNPRPQWVICTHELDIKAPVERTRAAPRQPNHDAPIRLPLEPASARKPGLNGGGDIHAALVSIWRELLGVEVSTPEADFFELGGDSLLAVQLRTRLESQFSREVSLKALLSRSTLGGMTQLLREAD